MKKSLCFALILIFLAPQTIFAAPNRSVAGHYYYTDIKTYFFGAPITAYNLGGKTAIVCEDLNWHYGHSVYWYADERKLTVDGRPVAVDPPYSLRTMYKIWVPLAPTLDALGAQYEWDAELNKFTVTSFDPSKIKTAEPLQSEFISYLGESCTTVELRLYYKDKEIPMTMTIQKGHMQNVYEETLPLNAVVRNGVVYLPLKTITDCLGLELTTDEEENIIIPG